MDVFGLRLLAVPALMMGGFLLLIAAAKLAGAMRTRRTHV